MCFDALHLISLILWTAVGGKTPISRVWHGHDPQQRMQESSIFNNMLHGVVCVASCVVFRKKELGEIMGCFLSACCA